MVVNLSHLILGQFVKQQKLTDTASLASIHSVLATKNKWG
jgi:hypothetical protein